MQLRAMRIRKGRQQKELAKAIGTDEPMMSKFENYKCLPIPPMMKALCDELGCEVGDIYEPHEIFLTSPKVTVKVSKGSKKKKEFYHLTVNLPPEARAFFKEALGKCGFKDITSWVNHCFERLKAKYSQILEDEKNSALAAKHKNEV